MITISREDPSTFPVEIVTEKAASDGSDYVELN